MSDQASSPRLLAQFADGIGVAVTYQLDQRRVGMVAYDVKSRQWYRLTFGRCAHVYMDYGEHLDDDERDHGNLTQGIVEILSPLLGVRRFQIGFVDDDVLDIACRSFSMEPFEGPEPP